MCYCHCGCRGAEPRMSAVTSIHTPVVSRILPLFASSISDSNPTSTRLRPQRQGHHHTLLSVLCPCSQVQAMRRAHLLDDVVPSYRLSSSSSSFRVLTVAIIIVIIVIIGWCQHNSKSNSPIDVVPPIAPPKMSENPFL